MMESIQEHCSGSRKRFTILTVTNVVLATVVSVYFSMQNISHTKAGEMPHFTAVRARISKNLRPVMSDHNIKASSKQACHM